MLGGAAGLLLFMVVGNASANGGVGTIRCGTDVTLTYTPTTLSAPNHKLVPITITGTDTDNDSDTFTVTVTSIHSDQVEGKGEGCGSPKQKPDFTGIGDFADGSDASGAATISGVAVRDERCAREGSRHYDIFVSCAESVGPTSTADLVVTVPKNQDH
jgi:endo-1,4-beta-xylanase